MDRKPISGLSLATAVDGTESMVIVQDGTTKKTPVVEYFKALGPTVDYTAYGEDAAGINAAIAARSAAGGGVVRVPASAAITAEIDGADNVLLEIPGGVTLTFVASVTNAIDYGGTTGFGVTGSGTIALQGNATFGLAAAGAKKPYVGPITITGWRYGIYWTSTAAEALEDFHIADGFTLGVPHTANVVYPIQITNRPSINGKWVQGGYFGAVICTAPTAGEYSASNEHTADQFALQGVRDVLMSGAETANGGENALAISIGSQNITLTGVRGSAADGHGLSLGSGSSLIDFGTLSGTFTSGESVTITDSADGGYSVTATVSGVFSDRLYLQSISGGRLRENTSGSTITVTGGTSGATAQITASNLTKNIFVDKSCIFSGNGLDEGAGGSNFAGIFMTQCESVYLDCLVEGNPFGMIVANSTWTEGENFRLLDNTTDYSESGDQDYFGLTRNKSHTRSSPLIEATASDQIIFGPNQVTTPLTASTNSGTNNGTRTDGSGRMESVGNNAPAFKANRTGTATTALGHNYEIYKLGAAVGGLGTAGLELPSFTVATLPTAASFTGYLAHVSDGDGGSECLALSDGSDWKVVASIGATVSAT